MQQREPQEVQCSLLLFSPSWVTCLGLCPMHQKVSSWIPGQGIYLGCGFNPWSGTMQEATD